MATSLVLGNPMPKKVDFEGCGDSSETSDGFVAIYNCDESHTGVLVRPQLQDSISSWRKLRRLYVMTYAAPRLGKELESLQVTLRKRRTAMFASVFEVVFALKNGNDDLITLFLEYAKQCKVITNPVVSDLRDRKIV